MANETFTSRLGLRKPAQTDYYDVDVFNGNADTIDAKTVKRPDSATSGNIAVFNGDRDVVDGGKPVSALVPKVPSATVGNLAAFTSGGAIGDSGYNATSLIAQMQSQITALKAKMAKFTFTMNCELRRWGNSWNETDVNKTLQFNFPSGYNRNNTDYAVTIRLQARDGESLEETIFGWGGDIRNNQGWILVEKATTYVKVKFQSDDNISRTTPFLISISGGLSFS